MIQIVPNKPGSEQIDWALRQPLIREGQTNDRDGQNIAGLNCIMTPMPRRSAVNAPPCGFIRDFSHGLILGLRGEAKRAWKVDSRCACCAEGVERAVAGHDQSQPGLVHLFAEDLLKRVSRAGRSRKPT